MGNAKSLLSTSKVRKLSPKTLAELQRHVDVDFTPAEIEDWYRDYRLSLNKGMSKLTINEFREIYNSVFDGDASPFVQHLFRSFDTDGDGFVDFKEFIVGLCLSGSDKTEKKLKWAFSMYDIDGNGTISQDEMGHVLKAIYKMTNSLEGGELGSPDDMSDAFFKKFDLNNDGQICFEEFRNGAMNDPIIIQLLQCDPDCESEN